MTETSPPPPPGPWGLRSQGAAASATAGSPLAAEPAPDKGQTPLWAVVSTLLLGGFIWAWTGSWIIAVALIWGLFVHEYGHVLAMNRLGMGPARIYIIPFLGGVAKSQRMPQSQWHGVLVALAGPAFGLLATLPFFAGFVGTGQPAWLVGAAVIAVLNLINLAPAPPLDGSKALGPVLARIHPVVERVVLIAIGALVVWWGFITGRWLLATFLAIALIGHLKKAAWRPGGRPLTILEAVFSLGLFVATTAACAAVGLVALTPLGGGSLPVALDIAGRELGFAR